jgi:transposase, IS30 family
MAQYRRLGHDDRCQIYALFEQGLRQQQIAGHLGVSQATISRELSRNSTRHGYDTNVADAKALMRQHCRARPRKLTPGLRRTILRLLQQKRWSPEQISAYLQQHGQPLSHETIYRLIRRDRAAGGELWRCLRRRAKPYNKRADKTAGRGIIPDRIDISCRPKIVEQRSRIGDWEGDTVLGHKRRSALLSIVERKSRLLKLALLPGATADATRREIVRLLKSTHTSVHTITFDNGKEFAQHKAIGEALNSRIYFARPYHAWERGLNENTNGLIRDFFPKGTDFSTVSAAQVAAVEHLLNTRPRKSLGYRTPLKVFQKATKRRLGLCPG